MITPRLVRTPYSLTRALLLPCVLVPRSSSPLASFPSTLFPLSSTPLLSCPPPSCSPSSLFVPSPSRRLQNAVQRCSRESSRNDLAMVSRSLSFRCVSSPILTLLFLSLLLFFLSYPFCFSFFPFFFLRLSFCYSFILFSYLLCSLFLLSAILSPFSLKQRSDC